MSALDKILAAVNPHALADEPESDGSALVLAAETSLRELAVLLAYDPDNDGDDDSSKSGDTDKDYAGKDDDGDQEDDVTKDPLYKKLIAKGIKPAAAAKMVKAKNKKVAASALVSGALVALAGLEADRSADWVEATAGSSRWMVALAGDDDSSDSKKPYGDVTYADPGYQADGKKRYPLDSEEHCRAAWSYINQSDNAKEYSSSQLASIKSKIKSALKKYGAQTSDDKSGSNS